MKKYRHIIIGLLIFLWFLTLIIVNQHSEKKQDNTFGTLKWLSLKVPIYDKNNVTLSGSVMNFVDSETKKQYSLELYGKIIKTSELQLVPLKLFGWDIKDKYLLVAFIRQDNKWVQKQGVLFGIDIQNISVELKDDIITVNFDDHDKKGVKIHKTQYFKIDNRGHFSLYFPKIDNGSMGLDIITKTWKWKSTTYSTGAIITPKKDVFILKMDENGKFSAKTDCNMIWGDFMVWGDGMAHFSDMQSTLMGCSQSQETEFSNMLIDIKSFTQTGSILTFWLKTKSGSMLFETMEPTKK
jgi:heat shock protein HslJ